MAVDFSTSDLNEVFIQALSDPSLRREAENRGAEYLKMQIFEDSFMERILPVNTIPERGGKVEDGFLDSHCEEFILFVEGQGGVTLQVPSRDVWNLCLQDQPHPTFEAAYQHSVTKDTRFHDKITGLLRRYSGNLIPFYEWERNRTVDMKQHKQKEEVKVSSEQSSGMGAMLKDAVKHGAEAAVVDQASEILLDAFTAIFDGNEAMAAALENEMGRETAKLITALAVSYVGHAYPEMVPQSDHIKRICSTIIENSTRNIIAPNLAVLTQQLGQLAKLGDAVPNVMLDTSDSSAKVEFEEESKARVPAQAGRFRDDK